MAWEVFVEDERGDVVQRLGIHVALDRQWTPEEIANFPWLTSIDPYGQTTFNFLQLRHVAQELRSLLPNVADPSQQQDLETLLRWVDDVPDRHLYLKLLGD